MKCARKSAKNVGGTWNVPEKLAGEFSSTVEIRRLKSALVKIRQQLWAKACSMICCGMDCCSMICFANAQLKMLNFQKGDGKCCPLKSNCEF